MGARKQVKNPDPPWKGQGGARIRIEHTIVKNIPMAGGKPLDYLQAWSRISTRVYRETNPGTGQGRARTQDRWTTESTSLTTWPRCFPDSQTELKNVGFLPFFVPSL